MKTCPQCNRTYDDRVIFCPLDGSGLVVGGRLVAGRYQIIEMIGRGGMGSVYKALDRGIARVCALKLFTEISGDDEAAVARFNREAINASRIMHPNAVAIYDFGQDEGGTPFLATEFVEGATLSEVLAMERALPIERALHISRQVADVLSYAHDLGIVHSDLKPHRIMLTRKGADDDYVKVLDLGLAWVAVEGGDETITKSGVVMGTPAYMSPEQARGEKLDARSDIYSLGLMTYEMLSGQLPFKGNTPLEMVIKRLSDEPVRLSEVAPSVSPDVERAVMSALARDRESRTPSARAFADHLMLERRPPPPQSTTVGSAPAPPQSAPKYSDRPAMQMPTSPMHPSEPERVTRPQPVGSPGPKSGMWDKITGMLGRRRSATGEIKAPPPPPAEPPRPTMELSEPEGVACPTCHAMNEAEWAFCKQCGSRMPQSASPPPIEPPRPMDPQTVVAQPTREAAPPQAAPAPPVSPPASEAGIVCEQCSGLNNKGSAFCHACGSPMTVAKSIVMSAPPTPPAPDKPDIAETIRRHTDVSFPAKVRVGKAYTLRIQIVPAEIELESGEVRPTLKPHTHDITMSLEVPGTGTPIRVTVSVAAENFEIEGPSRSELIVPVSGKSPAATFQLTGQEEGPGRIMLDFAQDGRPVGSVDLAPEVIPYAQKESLEQAPAYGGVGFNAGPASTPDVVIKVFEHLLADQPGRLHFVLSSVNARLKDLPVMDGDLGTVDLRAEVAQWVERQLRRVGTIARKSDSSPEVVSRVLSDVGNSLYDQLLPQALKEICWILRDRGVKSMLILSDEPHIPWELIKPYRANPVTGDFDEEGEFWGESFALTHWLRGRPPAEQLSFNRIFAVAAGGPSEQGQAAVRDFAPDHPTASSLAEPSPGGAGLKAADEELSILRSFEARGSRINVLPARASELRQAFETGDFDLLHLACHGAFGGQSAGDASAVLMEDGTFSALDLSPRMAATLRRAAPLIFFNACHSGRIGFSLTRLGSWGAQLVQMGCGGFVGSLWPVTDEGALAFARAFYDAISAGSPIGEAMLQARLEVRRIYPNDPTWMAYCCFADPMAKVAT